MATQIGTGTGTTLATFIPDLTDTANVQTALKQLYYGTTNATLSQTTGIYGALYTLYTGNPTLAGNVTISGTLTVNGGTTTINSTTITIDDKLVELGAVASPTNTTADGGGISLFGTTNKTILWDNTNANWTTSENWNLATGKTLKINNVDIASGTGADLVLGANASNTIAIGANGGTATILNPTVTLTNATNLNINGATQSIVGGTVAGTASVFNTNTGTVNLGGAATTLTVGNTATGAQTVNMFAAATAGGTYNIATAATSSGTKTINIGTAGGTGSTTTINIGTTAGTTPTIALNGAVTLGTTGLVGPATMAAFNTVSTTLNIGGAATALTLGGTPTTAVTGTFMGNATASTITKTINIGTGGASGSITNISLGSTTSGATGTTKLTTGISVATPPSVITATTYTMGVNDTVLIFNTTAACTLTMLSAATYPGKVVWVKQIAAFAVSSSSSTGNLGVQPLTSTTAGTTILSGAGKFAQLVSNGTDWVIMNAN